MESMVHFYYAWLTNLSLPIDPNMLYWTIKRVIQLQCCYSGVPQGKVLTPQPFLLYINDLPSCVCYKVKLCADDINFYFIHIIICSETDYHVLQQDINAFAHWAHIWQMEFNPKKCEFIRITNKNNNLLFTIITLSLSILTTFYTQNTLV